jgi:hypothetical protein
MSGERFERHAPAGSADGDALEREARLLARAQHPGVVQLVGFDGHDGIVSLVTTAAPGSVTLAAALTPSSGIAVDAAKVFATLTATLGDLHHIGIAHGDIRAEHVLVDGNNDAVLGGFHRARLLAGPPRRWTKSAEAREDLRALEELRRRCEGGGHADLAALPPLRRNGSAPQVAAGDPALTINRRPLTRWMVVLAATLAVGVALADGRHRRSMPPRPSSASVQPIAEVGGHRYAAGVPGDVVAVGRWRCQGATAAVLRPSSGAVWVFDRWPPPGTRIPGRLVAQVSRARGLGGAAAGQCDALVVRRAGRPAVVIRLGPQ